MNMKHIDWDDLRLFLAVARQTSIRQAAIALNVSHSTVLRRINTFEKTLGTRLFERQANGYFMTAAGEGMLESATKIEAEMTTVNDKAAGYERASSSKIRITLPGIFCSHLLMPEFAIFQRENPEVILEIIPGYAMANLAKREADVAIRVSNDPPNDLVGRHVLDMGRATYVRKDLVEKYGTECPDKVGWVSWSDHPSSQLWKEESDYPEAATSLVTSDPISALTAVKAGMGMSLLPCFVGDKEDELCRMPPGSLHWCTNVWVLTHEDLRNTARIQNFTAFISTAIRQHRDLIEGKRQK